MNLLYGEEHLGAKTKIFDALPQDESNSAHMFTAALRASSPDADAVMHGHVKILSKDELLRV